MTDNRLDQVRYVSGKKGHKRDLYKCGIRVLFYMKYPSVLEKNKDIEATDAHIDILPSLTDISNAELLQERKIDDDFFTTYPRKKG